MNDILLFERADKTSGATPFLRIERVCVKDGRLGVTVVSDCTQIDLYIGGELRSRSKSSGTFQFDEELPSGGNTTLRAESRDESTLFDEVSLTI